MTSASADSSHLTPRRVTGGVPIYCRMFVLSTMLLDVSVLSVEFLLQTSLQLSPRNAVIPVFFFYLPVVKISMSFPCSAILCLPDLFDY